jgi:hypothetical protein
MKPLNLQPFNTIQKLHSKDYTGEWINVELSKDKIDRRFIKPNIVFENPSGQAICLGNGESRSEYALKKFERTNGRKLLRYYNVMYGCNGVYREYQPDFLILSNQLLAAKLPAELHDITFSNQEIMRRYPSMNLIPGAQRLDAGATAALLAAFHGAKKVFLFGYDGQPEDWRNNNIYAGTEYYQAEDFTDISDQKWAANLANVIQTHDDVEFIRVANPSEDSYRRLRRYANFSTINFREFVTRADL